MRNKQEKEPPKILCPFLKKITERFVLLFAGGKIVIPKNWEKGSGRTTLQSSGSTKMLAKGNFYAGPEWEKTSKTSAVHALRAWVRVWVPVSITADKKHQTTGLPVLTEPGREIQFDFPLNNIMNM